MEYSWNSRNGISRLEWNGMWVLGYIERGWNGIYRVGVLSIVVGIFGMYCSTWNGTFGILGMESIGWNGMEYIWNG
jgi:hypothetical protein